MTAAPIPRVSVCVPALNAARTIRMTIESILGQDFPDLELIVLDNNSDDDTADLARSFGDSRVRIHRNSRTLSMPDNWNRVVGLATTDLVKVVPADDLLAPHCLSEQVRQMCDGDIAVVSSKYDQIDDEGSTLATSRGLPGLTGRHSPSDALRTFVRKRPDDIAPTAAAMFRRAQFAGTAGFRAAYGYAMDIDMWARLCGLNGDFFGSPDSLAISRASAFNYSSRTSTLRKLTEMARFNHAMSQEFPDAVGWRDVLAGDLDLARTALRRFGYRARRVMPA